MWLLLQRSFGLDRASLRASYSPYIPLFIFCVPLSRFHLPPPRCHLLSSLPWAPLFVSPLPGEGSTGGALSHVAPPGLFLLVIAATAASPCVTRAAAALPRHRQSRQRGQREGKSPSRQGASTAQQRHKHTHGPPRTRRPPGTSRATESEQRRPGSSGSSLHLHRGTYGKAKESQHLVFHNQTSNLPFSSTGSSIVSREGGAEVLLHLVECPWIVKAPCCVYSGPSRRETESCWHHTVQISNIYIGRSSITVSNTSNLIHCFLCSLGNRGSIPRILYQGVTAPECIRLWFKL